MLEPETFINLPVSPAVLEPHRTPHTPPENFSTLTLAFAATLLKSLTFLSLLSRKRSRKRNACGYTFFFSPSFSCTYSFFFILIFFTSTSIPFLFCLVSFHSISFSFPFSSMPHSFLFLFVYPFFHLDTFCIFIFFPFLSFFPFLFFFLHYSFHINTLSSYFSTCFFQL